MQRTLGPCVLGWEHRGLGLGMLGAGPGTGAVGGRGERRGTGVCLLLSWGQEPGASSEERAELDWYSRLGMAWELVGI